MKAKWLFPIWTGCLAAQTVALPPGAAVHVKNLNGDVAIEGWDRPDVELAAPKGAPVSIAAQGNEVLIASTAREHGSHQDYSIRMPRDARLVVEHRDGEVDVAEVTGDVRATVCRGEIVLRLPASGQYGIDARSKWGEIVSDFPAPAGASSRRRPWLIGHRLEKAAGAGAHQLYLRAGFGDILVLKILQPAAAGPPAP